ncbi:hypothetical protein ACFFHC_04070 [Kytococcus schroeteri]|uniref:hypothetical protein n=1 Tax=Kytococcus schroeteri TaxID=138300 RepID=UPI0035EE9992
MNTQTRRVATCAALWSVPAVVATAAAPALAASVSSANLAVTVEDPNFDWDTLEYALDDTIWKNYEFFDQMKQPDPNRLTTVATRQAALPPSITVTNVGPGDAVNPTGTVEFEMRDYGSDSAPLGSDQLGAVTTNTAVTWVRTSTGRTARGTGQMYMYTYNGTLAPGQSFTMPLKYYSPRTFTNVTFNLMVKAVVSDAVENDIRDEFAGYTDDHDEKVGYVVGYSTS